MNKTFPQTDIIALLILSLTTSVAADLVIKSRITGDFSLRLPPDLNSDSYETTTYFKGARQREDRLGTGMIYQCDIKQSVWFNSLMRTYLVYSPTTMPPEEKERIARDKLRGEKTRAVMAALLRARKSLRIQASDGRCSAIPRAISPQKPP